MTPRKLVLAVSIAAAAAVLAQSGAWIDQQVHCAGLEDNLIGTRPDQLVRVYLPPGYDAEPERRYPSLYLLHGYFGTASAMGYIKEQADELIAAGEIEPLIIVTPTARNRYEGSFYSNSSTIGQWEDFITGDVIDYVDGSFRTLAQRENRGIAGYSMGGYGTIKLAMRHPDLYGAAYSVNACCLSLEAQFMELDRQHVRDAGQVTMGLSFGSQFWKVQAAIAAGAAFAPNPEAEPFFADFPLAEDGSLVQDVWDRWLAHDPLTMVATHGEGLKLVHLALDMGDVDDVVAGNEEFSQALTAAGVPHRLEIYPGDHFSGIEGRMRTKVLPFMAEMLSSSVSSAVEEVSWAGVKEGAR